MDVQGTSFGIVLPSGHYKAYVDTAIENGLVISNIVSFTVEKSEKMLGDLNQDNSIKISDTVILQKYILGIQILTQEQAKLADMTQDGTINIFDLTILKHQLLS